MTGEMDPSRSIQSIDYLLLRLSALKEKVAKLEEKVKLCKAASSKSDGRLQQKR